jgi:REP element-mobilizing transposase RayT
MADIFQNKYRIPSARAAWWDYGNGAAYFITICTDDRIHYFGEIHNGKMELSEIGQTALQCWHEIPNQFPFAKLDSFVIMPNHIHGILEISCTDAIHRVSENTNTPFGRDAIHRVSENTRDAMNRVSTKNIGGITGNNNPMLSDNLSRIIRWYKGRTTFFNRKIHADFAWQTRFWDHIIRDDDAYFRIKTYIETNPERWNDDQMNAHTNVGNTNI